MASFTLTRPDLFPSGTSVSVYAQSARGELPSSGAPTGSAVDTGTVSGDSVTFTGLADETRYIAYAAGPDRYLRFSTPPASTGGGSVVAGLTWQASTAYVANQVVMQNGIFYQANADFTSGASFDPANWTVVGPQGELAYAEINSSYTKTASGGTWEAIPGLSVTVTATGRRLMIEAQGYHLSNTGTPSSAANNFIGFRVFDVTASAEISRTIGGAVQSLSGYDYKIGRAHV